MIAHSFPQVGESAGALNGNLPDTFADQIIKYRIPYTMPGEHVVGPDVTADQFNEATFLHTIDKPFEVHRLHVELSSFTGTITDSTMIDLLPATMDRRVRLRIEATEKNEKVTKNPALVATLVDALTHIWEWEAPYTITRQEGFTISVDTQAFPIVCLNNAAVQAECTSVATQVDLVRVEIQLQGYLIVIRPASDSR